MDETFWEFAYGKRAELALLVGEHLRLTGVALTLAIATGLGLSLLALRFGRFKNVIVGLAGVMQTIPSLAMLTLLLTLIGQIGAVPAVIALTLYALLPIVRNAIAGLEGVPANMMEAARGIGMTDRQAFFRVRLPLALPVLVAGVRTAAVISIGIATLSAFIGAGGLGVFINSGLALNNPRFILLGAIPAAALALLVDFLIGGFNWALHPKRRTRGLTPIRAAALAGPFALFGGGVVAHAVMTSGKSADMVIASKNFTEQYILTHMMAEVIEDQTGLQVDRRIGLGGTMICHEALMKGEIDAYPEYTGTGLVTVLKLPPRPDPDAVFNLVNEEYRKRYGLEWRGEFGINNTYAIAVRAADAERNGWRKVSDLRAAAGRLHAGFTSEFTRRDDGYPGLKKKYGFGFNRVTTIEPAVMYQALAKGEVDVIAAFSTDGRIAANNLVTLEDDRRFFPPYYAACVVRSELIEKYPAVGAALRKLRGVLTQEEVRRLNYAVDAEKRDPKAVAREFLIEKGVIEP